MTTRLIDIFRNSGDRHIGQTLVRMAELAEASHRADVVGRAFDRLQHAHNDSPDGRHRIRMEVDR